MSSYSSSTPMKKIQQQQKPVKKTKNDVTQNKNYQLAQEKELVILEKYAKLQVGIDIRIENVEFTYNGKQTFIHTLISGENNTNCIVFLHGYLASSLFYYKMIKKFSQNYKVISIDLLGMGLSDRQDFDIQEPKDYKSATKFFIESLEEWRKAIGLEKFILAGHSFGGFISFNYYLNYPQQVEQIYLISPMSASKLSGEDDLRDEESFNKYVSSLKFKTSLFPKFLRYMHNKRATLSSFLQSWFVPSNYFINKIVDSKFDFDTEDERSDWKVYFKAVQFLPESTDHLIHEFVSMPYVQPKISIEDLCEQNNLKSQKIPVHFIFGNYDWMDHSGTVRLLQSNQLFGTLRFVKNSGHLIPFEQPDSLVKLMLDQMKHHAILQKQQSQKQHNQHQNKYFIEEYQV